MEMVELTFKYTQEEYVKAVRQYLFASKTITKLSVVVLSLFLPFSICYLIISTFSLISIVAVGIALFAVIAGCVLYFYMPVNTFKKTSKYHEEYHLIFSWEGIKFISQNVNSELKWDIYTEFWESDDFYFLIQAPRMYTLIPKRGFLNLHAKQTFEEIALTSLKCSKRIL